MKRAPRLAWVVALFTLLGCGDEAASGKLGAPSAPASDAGVAAAPIPLILWVDDLVDHGEGADPDTVHDKNIADDQDSAHFDKYFSR